MTTWVVDAYTFAVMFKTLMLFLVFFCVYRLMFRAIVILILNLSKKVSVNIYVKLHCYAKSDYQSCSTSNLSFWLKKIRQSISNKDIGCCRRKEIGGHVTISIAVSKQYRSAVMSSDHKIKQM